MHCFIVSACESVQKSVSCSSPNVQKQTQLKKMQIKVCIFYKKETKKDTLCWTFSMFHSETPEAF